ncbi:MAG: hypothetical protein LBN95_08840 [Prevotellaceae bacterium]|jgi:hypothetical protein|nr:hypothetical protein [Prevotellaceae bacterium]
MKKNIAVILLLTIFNSFFVYSQKKDKITPEQYQTMGEDFYTNYEFDKAAECFAKSGDTRSERRSAMAAEMLQRVENVQFIDSIVVNADEILKYFPKNSEIGFIYEEKYVAEHLFGFLTGKQDRKIFAKTENSQTALYQSNQFLNGWSEPTPIFEQANFNKGENYPFVLSDGITLYFASTHNTLGGYDIFMSRAKPSGEYLLPQNIGMPFNSPANDYLMVIDETQKLGYFASDRNLPTGKIAIYTFIYNSEKNILRDRTTEELREAAQIKDFVKAPACHTVLDTVSLNQKTIAGQARNDTAAFTFVITDTIIYHALADFKNQAAQEKFVIWQQKAAELENTKKMLENLRKDYFFAESPQRFIFKEKIISFENLQKSLEKEVKNLENEVRFLEIND